MNMKSMLRAGMRVRSVAADFYCQACLVTTVRAATSSAAGLPQYKHGIHRSSAEKLISKVPVVTVDAHVAVCDGGSGALGHPVEYIQLDTVSNKPQVCKYCGLQFKMGEPHLH